MEDFKDLSWDDFSWDERYKMSFNIPKRLFINLKLISIITGYTLQEVLTILLLQRLDAPVPHKPEDKKFKNVRLRKHNPSLLDT